MNIFRKKLPDYEWLTAALPLFEKQKRLVDDFGGTLLAQGSDEIAPEAAVETSVEAFVELDKQTQRNQTEVTKIGTPIGSSARQAYESFQKTLTLWKLAGKSGKGYSRMLASGIVDRTLSGGISGRLSGSAMVSQAILFSETMKKAQEGLEYTGRLIESLEKEIMATTPPSKVIAAIPFGKELLDGMEGVTTLLDSGFEGWEPPYAPLPGLVEYDEDEQTEIDKATSAKQDEHSHLMDTLAPEHRPEVYDVFIARDGVANGLMKASSIRFREDRDYHGALSTWLKWLTHRSQYPGWGLDPDAWMLLTEIYAGIQDIPKAKQMLASAVSMVAAELEESASYMDRGLVRAHQLPKRLEQLDPIRRRIHSLDSEQRPLDHDNSADL